MDYNIIKHEIFSKIYNNKIIKEQLEIPSGKYNQKEDYVIDEIDKTTNEIIKILNDVFNDNDETISNKIMIKNSLLNENEQLKQKNKELQEIISKVFWVGD